MAQNDQCVSYEGHAHCFLRDGGGGDKKGDDEVKCGWVWPWSRDVGVVSYWIQSMVVRCPMKRVSA